MNKEIKRISDTIGQGAGGGEKKERDKTWRNVKGSFESFVSNNIQAYKTTIWEEMTKRTDFVMKFLQVCNIIFSLNSRHANHPLKH